MTDLSVIIPSYNTRDMTARCLTALYKNLSKYRVRSEVIVVDNSSTDGTKEMLDEYEVIKIFNVTNLGFSRAINQGVEKASGKYILLLNSDAIVDDVNFKELFSYFRKNTDVAALTVRVNLPSGKIDPASHRGFPTVWRAFCYFSGLEKIFAKVLILNRLFGGYHLTYLNLESEHEIDSPTGAFYLVRSDVLRKLMGLDDKNFFFYGEDLDLSYRIKQEGYKIIYYPKYSVLHLKYVSGFKANEKTRRETKNHFYDAMKIFYRKHYEIKHSWLTKKMVYWAIELKKKMS